MTIKHFIRKRPFVSILLGAASIFLLGYFILLMYVLRPINLMNGRVHSYDKIWSDIELNINYVKIGTSLMDVKQSLGNPDEIINMDSSTIWSYQQYGVIAPYWIYDIHIINDSVQKIEHYNW